MVIGGGPGGMEAARIAALRGHDVSLYEKEDALGGQARWAAKPPFRGEYEQVIRYLSHHIKKAGFAVHLCQEVDKGRVYEEKPDVVIIATGAYPYKGHFPGRDKPHVCTYLDILNGGGTPGKKAAVIGGDKIACEVAEFIVEKGSEVFLADSNDSFCQDCGQKTRWMIMERLESEEKVEMRSRTTLEKIDDTSITIQKNGAIEQIDGIDTA
jgi:pyruvate/2-oxoglutarate dehydrogenase complex dihydrolipoamide dehydrogenase (E3) component